MLASSRTIELIGGAEVLGREVRSALDWVHLVRAGLPLRAAEHLLKSGWLTAAEMDHTVLPRKTLSNRKKQGALTAEQSDRLLRVARVMALAADCFGDDGKAQSWLRRPTALLGGEAPLRLLDTDEGARAVEAALGRIAHGIAA